LVANRTQVVFGEGSLEADLMIVGEAPGRVEDELGRPFAGAASELLDRLLAGVGLTRADVFLTTCLMCRPPGNREPLPQEVANCQGWLHAKLERVRPRVVCTLGNFATKAVRGEPAPVTRLHGRPEVRVIGAQAVRLLPLYHPAAALYTRSLLDALEADFAQIPALLALDRPDAPAPAPPPPAPEPGESEGQLGLFWDHQGARLRRPSTTFASPPRSGRLRHPFAGPRR
jgi:uracil-DNA glycosylase